MSAIRSVLRVFTAALAALTMAPAAVLANQYWVGNGGLPPCTHATLQQAIDAAQFNSGDDVIHLVGAGPFTGPFSILGGGIQIVGGVASCGSTTSTGYATVRAPSGKRPLTILMGETGLVTLRRLKITTQLGTFSGDGGGIWFAGAGDSSQLDLNDSQVFNNGALSDGGGIFVSNGVVRLLGGSLVYANTAKNGGGIAGDNGSYIWIDNGAVTANTALFDGGGIYMPGAALIMGFYGLSSSSAAVANNVAGGDGGGIYAGAPWANSSVESASQGTVSAITGNQARRGGGLFLEGGSLRLDRVDVNLNSASEQGGGAFVASGGRLTSNTGFQLPPPVVDGYPRFVTNKAAAGSGLYIDGLGSSASLHSGSFRDHQGGPGGAALAAMSGGASLWLIGVTVSGNQVPELFALEGANMLLEHVSIAGNNLNRLVRWDGAGIGIQVTASSFSETEPFFSGLGATQTLPRFSCVVSHFASMLQGMPPGTDLSQVFVGDPRFVNPAAGNLHAFGTSFAVDRCSQTGGFYDSDAEARGFDDPYRVNPAGQTYDAGADEIVSIFWDDLEAGNAVRWSFTAAGVAGGNNVQVTPAARLGPPSSQFGLQVNLVNPSVQAPVATYVAAGPNRGFSNETTLKGSFFIDPQGVTMSTAAGANSFQMIAFNDGVGAGTKTRMLFHLSRANASGWFINVWHWNDNTGGFQFSGGSFFACADASCGVVANWRNNRIDFEWKAGNPGHLTMWRTRYLNGVPDASGTIQMVSVDLPGMQ
ncbi:MAG TPA: hypothetical protein VGX68_19465, partial [Thermoanaerobaculia bacterium]|nr:hypothetical protein [Thermoanaerobaculia bacterium]